MTSQSGPHVALSTREGLIDLSLGQPSPRLLPREQIARAARDLANADPLVLQYGAVQGFLPFRRALAEFLTREHSVEVRAEELALSGAISLSLSLLADVFGRRRGLVFCEDPTYFRASGIFRSAGLRVVGVPVDAEGLRVDAVARKIEGGEVPDFVYVIPSFQNPTGVDLSAPRREALFALARRHEFLIISDEPYNLLSFDGSPRRPLATYKGARGRVISVSSFSKILAPGLRTGWWHAEPELLAKAQEHGALLSGGNLNPVMGQILLPLITGGELSAYVERLRSILSERRDVVCAALERHLPEARFRRPAGGYFVWLELARGTDMRALLRRARDLGVSFCPGERCTVDENRSNCLRLSLAFYESEELVRGLERLAEALRFGAAREPQP